MPALAEYYRCPSQFARFDVSGVLSDDEGFFAFGGATCYGRRVGPARIRQLPSDLADVSNQVEYSNGIVRLPFNLSEVAGNLRLERYTRNSRRALERLLEAGAARSAYYFLRPALPVAIRKHLQRAFLNGWESVAFPRWPVDFTVETLMRKTMSLELKRLGIEKIPFIWFWPDGAPSCAILTHDVEHKAGRDFCASLMDLDDAHHIKSAFQIVPEGRYKGAQALCDSIRSRSFEVNVHDLNHDGHLFESHQEFLRRAAKINQYGRAFHSRGFRAAAMYREQRWYDALDFSYDMSVPNVAHLEPQRGGCCTVMPYFVGNMVELPLTTSQDYSMFHIIGDYSINLWKKQTEEILSRNGLISFLTHPDYLIEKRARAVYVELLAYLTSLRDTRDVWVTLPAEVDRWWRSRNSMSLVPDGESWRITGPDSHRARVAYAVLENDDLVYKLAS